MTKRGAFTLIELLVVIAIIAVLMGILMPALNRVKEQARNTACLARLRQWGLVLNLYTQDNNGKFYSGELENFDGDAGSGEWWRELLRPLTKDEKMWICPSAKVDRSAMIAQDSPAQDPYDAWRVAQSKGGDIGSYTPNGWMCNPSSGNNLWNRGPMSYYWRTALVKNASEIPVFSEGWWVDAWPRQTDKPPPTEFDPPPVAMLANSNEMQRVCVNRHKGTQNVTFADWSVRRVSLKELWRLPWHKGYRINDPPPVWPEWMEKISDSY